MAEGNVPDDGKSFNLRMVHSLFKESLLEVGDVQLLKYLAGYKELNKFFELQGALFNFVSHDIETKINHINRHLQHENLPGATKDDAPVAMYKSVQEMLDLEKSYALWNKKGFVSGSRTFLRLHRGLEFIRLFLQELYALGHEEETANICRTTYASTLSQYHPWYIRKMADVVMYTMPVKKQLLMKVCGSEENITQALEEFPETLDLLTEVYNRSQALYDQYGALNLA